MTTRKRTGTKLLKSGRNIVKKSTLRAKRFFNKKGNKSTKRIKLTIKNLGKRKNKRTSKRIQYGCRLKKMRGGGIGFQPLTDVARNFSSTADDFQDKLMGNVSTVTID
jgi:hypothetical protein|tara:strand:- start:4763 stop:5086 length:324 start_codon:yes stop_codon:yes gene_type:complete